MKFKSQKILGVLFFSVFFFLFSASIATEKKGNEELEKLKAFKAAYPNTSKDYRGVVAIDANGGCADELFCDFGSNGLWVYEAPNWTKLNAADPDNGFVSDYDGDGNDEVFLFFGGNGLWIYDKGAATILTKLHATSPDMFGSLRMDCWTAGYEEGALDYSGQGLWSHYATGIWKKLSYYSPDDDNTSADFDNSDASEELIIDFFGSGMWAYNNINWYKITNSTCLDAVAVYLPTVADYELLCSFDSVSGLWLWDYSGYPGTWTKISNSTPQTDHGFCEPFDPNDDGWEEVAVDFAASGLWLYDHAAVTKWTKINTWDPEFMVRSDLKCEANDTVLVVDIGANGLWIYDGKAATWTKLSNFSPDGVY